METARSLADWLRTRDDADLVALLARRPDLASPVPHDFSGLASRATTRASVLRALDDLDRRRYAVVEALALLPDPTTYADLVDLAAGGLGTADELRAALDDLRTVALAWGDDDALRLVRAAREMVAMPAGLGPPAASVVEHYPRAVYAPLLEELGLPPAPDALIAADLVEGALADAAAVRARIDALDEPERATLDRLTWSPLGSVHGALRTVERGADQAPWQRLVACGLLVAVDPATVAVPREVGVVLRGGRAFPDGYADPPPLDVTERAAAASDRTAGGQALTVVTAVADLLHAWGVAPPPMLRSGGLGVRELRRTARDLDLPEEKTALVVEVAYAAGLVAPSAEPAPVWLPTPAFDGWLRMPPPRRWVTLTEAWLGTPRAPGLVGGRDDRDRNVNALSSDVEWPAVTAIRAATLDVLAGLPAGAAPSVESVIARVGWLAPRRLPERTARGVTWTLAEAEMLGVTGGGALSSPGRSLVAGDAAGAADALAPLLPEPVDHVLLQADLTAVAPGPLVPDLAAELRLAADVESTGGATVYRFTEESIRRALDAGRSAAELHDLLERRSRTPVPQPLHYLVDDVARRHGRIRVGTAQAYVRSDDPAVLQEILVAKRAEPLRPRLLAPTVLAVSATIDRVLDVLRSLGHAPVAESAEGGVVVQRRDSRRAAPRPRPPRAVEPHAPPREVLDVAVRAVRAGDRVSREAPPLTRPTSPAETLRIVQRAAAEGRPLWIGYLNAEGEASRRLIEPHFVEGGAVVAYDHRRSEVRTFLVHRITGVATIPAESAEATP